MWINPMLKIVPNRCFMSSCLFDESYSDLLWFVFDMFRRDWGERSMNLMDGFVVKVVAKFQDLTWHDTFFWTVLRCRCSSVTWCWSFMVCRSRRICTMTASSSLSSTCARPAPGQLRVKCCTETAPDLPDHPHPALLQDTEAVDRKTSTPDVWNHRKCPDFIQSKDIQWLWNLSWRDFLFLTLLSWDLSQWLWRGFRDVQAEAKFCFWSQTCFF